MLLKRISIKRLRNLRDFECDLASGVTLIMGPNEAGKSSLVEGLLLALFGNVGSTAKAIDECKSWSTDMKPDILLEFNADGSSFTLHKDFHNRSVELRNQDTGEVWTDRRSVDQFMADALGVATERLYTSTACISQAEVRDIRHAAKELPSQLERRLTGAGLETSSEDALSWLGKRVTALKKTGTKPSTYGVIQAREAELGELESQLVDLQGPLQKRSEARARMSELGRELAGLRKELEASRSALEKVEAYAQAQEKRDLTGAQFGKVDQRTRRIEELNSRLKELDDQLAATKPVTEAELNKVRNLDAKREAKQEEKAQLQDKLAEPVPTRAPALLRFLPAVAIVAGLLMCVGTLMVWLSTEEIIYSAVPCMGTLVALLVGVASALWLRRVGDVTTHEADVQRLRATEEGLGRLEGELRTVLQRHDVSQVDQLHALAEEYQRVLESKKEVTNILEGLFAGETEEAIAAERERLLAQLALAEKTLSELGPYELDPVGIEKLRKRVGVLTQEEKKLSEQQLGCKLTLERETLGVEDLHELEERRAAIEDELSQLKRRLLVYEMALNTIAGARDEAIEAASSAVESAVASYMGHITSGRYDEIRWNKQDARFEVLSTEKEDWIAPGSELSTGTIDQLYLATRLALVGAICGDAKPPLIFDDPFVSFDETRKQNAMSLCKKLSAKFGYQIVFLTCDSSYEPLVDTVVEIGRV